jgi:hypothetical protein
MIHHPPGPKDEPPEDRCLMCARTPEDSKRDLKRRMYQKVSREYQEREEIERDG